MQNQRERLKDFEIKVKTFKCNVNKDEKDDGHLITMLHGEKSRKELLRIKNAYT